MVDSYIASAAVNVVLFLVSCDCYDVRYVAYYFVTIFVSSITRKQLRVIM